MAADYPSLSHSFVARQLIRASQIMQNYNDLRNGMIDGTKKINVAELWTNGTLMVDNSQRVTANKLVVDTFVMDGADFYSTSKNSTVSANIGNFFNVTVNNLVYVSGNLGVGTANPTQLLHVVGDNVSNYIKIETESTTHDAAFWSVGPSGSVYTGIQPNVGADNRDWVLYNTAVHIVVQPDGDVGLGMLIPSRDLHVNYTMRLEPSSVTPSTPAAGDFFYNGNHNQAVIYDGTNWQSLY